VRVGLLEAPSGERWEHRVVNLDWVAIALVINERGEALVLCEVPIRDRSMGL
jgi:hypothetical protein